MVFGRWSLVFRAGFTVSARSDSFLDKKHKIKVLTFSFIPAVTALHDTIALSLNADTLKHGRATALVRAVHVAADLLLLAAEGLVNLVWAVIVAIAALVVPVARVAGPRVAAVIATILETTVTLA